MTRLSLWKSVAAAAVIGGGAFAATAAIAAEVDGVSDPVRVVKIRSGEPITIYGDGQQTRSFCYVDDLVDAFLLLMDTGPDFQGPINLGSPGEFTILELAQEVLDITGSSSTLVNKPLPQDDPRQRQPDISLAREKLGWEPRTQLRDGLARTCEYFEQLLSRGAHAEPEAQAGSARP